MEKAAVQTVPRTDKDSWARAALALTAVGWGANQFAPMVLLYRERMGVSASAAEAVFGLYAAGLVPGLLVAGPLSDRVGRRPVVAFAVLLSMLSGVALMLLGWILVPINSVQLWHSRIIWSMLLMVVSMEIVVTILVRWLAFQPMARVSSSPIGYRQNARGGFGLLRDL